MKVTRTLVVLVLVAGTLSSALAQGYDDDRARRRERRDLPPAGFWPTEKMIDYGIDRITDQMAQDYLFDEDQLWQTRELIKERFPDWLQENRRNIQPLVNEWVEMNMAGMPPTKDEVADWAQRALPMFDEFREKVELTSQDMRDYMTDEQQVLLDGQIAAMNVGMNYVEQRMAVWAEGGWDWETEWPRSKIFREHERARIARLESEAQAAQNQALGIDEMPAEGGGAESYAAVSDVENPRRAVEQKPTPEPAGDPLNKDDWVRYTQDFIRRYQLDEAQRNRAMTILESLQQQRDRYLKRNAERIKYLERQMAAADTAEERESVQAAIARVQSTVERYFDQLKERLNTLPSRKQRALAAARTESARNAENEEAADDSSAALRRAMEQRAKAEADARERASEDEE
jgi:hypothetical protein